MSNESSITVITPKSIDEAKSFSQMISKSALLPDALRGKEAEILMTIMTGAELGLAPMQSIRAIDVIKGKPTLKAEAMTALVRGRRDVCEYLVLKESTAKRCTYETKRVGDPGPTTMSFGIEDAQAAGLLGNDNYKRFPAAMLRARAGSAICKAVYSDLILGFYDPDEMAPERPADVRDVTPAPLALVKPTPPPSNVIDSTATVTPPAAPDYGPNGEPLSERAKLEVAVAEAQNEVDLTKLVDRITKLPAVDKAEIRKQWGARRDELRAAQPTAPVAEPGSAG